MFMYISFVVQYINVHSTSVVCTKHGFKIHAVVTNKVSRLVVNNHGLAYILTNVHFILYESGGTIEKFKTSSIATARLGMVALN